jgi:hypothetical protein
VVVGLDAYDLWAEAHEDIDARIAVLEWLVGLQASGPPTDGVFDSHRDTWSVVVPGADVTVEYVVAPFLDPPAIACRRFR